MRLGTTRWSVRITVARIVVRFTTTTFITARLYPAITALAVSSKVIAWKGRFERWTWKEGTWKHCWSWSWCCYRLRRSTCHFLWPQTPPLTSVQHVKTTVTGIVTASRITTCAWCSVITLGTVGFLLFSKRIRTLRGWSMRPAFRVLRSAFFQRLKTTSA